MNGRSLEGIPLAITLVMVKNVVTLKSNDFLLYYFIFLCYDRRYEKGCTEYWIH